MLTRPVLFAVVFACAAALSACGGSAAVTATSMSPANETPAATAPGATGSATFTLSGSTVNYTVTFSGLTGSATMGHLHAGVAGTSGGVVVAFSNVPAAASGTFSGSITSADIKANASANIVAGDLTSFLTVARAGGIYINIHTAANPGGEIRGQVVGL